MTSIFRTFGIREIEAMIKDRADCWISAKINNNENKETINKQRKGYLMDPAKTSPK
jgi:hypothetical protein